MIATAVQNDAWKFQDPLKQRVSDYFRLKPDGNWDHFREFGQRSHQIPKDKFMDVHKKLQIAQAIPMISGGKAHEILAKQIRKSVEEEFRRPIASYSSWSPEDEDGATDPKPTEQAPTVIPNTPVNTPEPVKEAMPAKKELSLKEMSEEQRKQFDTVWKRSPKIAYDDLVSQLDGFSIAKSVYYSTAYAIKTGKYGYNGLPQSQKPATAAVSNRGSRSSGAPTPAPVAAPASLGVTAVLNPDVRINSPQIIGQDIECDGMTPEEVRTLQKYLPTALAMLLGRKMQFKVGRLINIDENDKEVPSLQVRRIA